MTNKPWRGWFREVRQSLTLPWLILFLLISTVVTQDGGTNARARIAGLRAITEAGTMRIDNYLEWTYDWSLSPNGFHYPNKAPGGVLLGLPVFALLDYPTLWLQRNKVDEKGRAPMPGYLELLLLSLFTQMLPFCALVLYAERVLRERGVPAAGVHFFALAALLGNTAGIYLNCYFGHGLAALFFTAGTLAWLQRRYAWAAAGVAAAALSDYGGACVAPLLVIATLWRERSLHPIPRLALGAAPFLGLWVWYHTVAFGGPFEIASKFINPEQLSPLEGQVNLWGTMGLVPSPEILWKLLFGTSRGILFTQPWVLVAAAMLWWPAKLGRVQGLAPLLCGGLAGLLWLNASVGGWHGGHTVGPRYLSLIFPAFALAAAWLWPQLPPASRYALALGLAVALTFRLFIFPFTNLAPDTNLWAWYWEGYANPKNATPFVRIGLGLILSGSLVWWAVRTKRISSP